MGIETRLHPRISIDWYATVRTSEGSIEVKTINISVGGACILYPTGYEFQRHSSVLLKPPGTKPIHVVATPVWSDKSNHGNRMICKIGVRFLAISPEDERLIEALVQKEK